MKKKANLERGVSKRAESLLDKKLKMTVLSLELLHSLLQMQALRPYALNTQTSCVCFEVNWTALSTTHTSAQCRHSVVTGESQVRVCTSTAENGHSGRVLREAHQSQCGGTLTHKNLNQLSPLKTACVWGVCVYIFSLGRQSKTRQMTIKQCAKYHFYHATLC